MIVQNSKPNVVTVSNPKPNNVVVESAKPNMSLVNPLNEQYYPVTVTVGMPRGLLLALTYNTSFTVSSSKSP